MSEVISWTGVITRWLFIAALWVAAIIAVSGVFGAPA